MADWLVNLIVGLGSAVIGALVGYFTKTVQVKNQQEIKGNNNTQLIERIDPDDKE